jgi:hypothetical protein
LRQSFVETCYVERRNIAFEGRFAHGNLDRVPALAADLVSLKLDVVVSLGAVGAQAARKASTTMPIVFVVAIDPVAVGFATTVDRSGGNITGITSFDPQQATKAVRAAQADGPSASMVKGERPGSRGRFHGDAEIARRCIGGLGRSSAYHSSKAHRRTGGQASPADDVSRRP